jgi:alpha-galactosidase
MSAWVTDSPNFPTGPDIPLGLRIHVAMPGILGVGGDIAQWSTRYLDTLQQAIARYKRIRAIIQHGEVYQHHPDDNHYAWQ